MQLAPRAPVSAPKVWLVTLFVFACSLVASTASAQNVTFRGTVRTYPSNYKHAEKPDIHGDLKPYEPVRQCAGADCEVAPGRKVTITTGVSRPSTTRDSAGCKYCYRKWITYQPSVPAVSDANGSVEVSIPADHGVCTIPEESRLVRQPDGTYEDFYCPAVNDYYLAVSAVTEGSDAYTTVASFYTSKPTSNVTAQCKDPITGATTQPPCDLLQAPHGVSPRGMYWARMFTAPNLTRQQLAETSPIFLIEGFDPRDEMKSDELARFVAGSQLPGGGNLLSYVTNPANKLTLYVLNSGFSGGNSIVGPATDFKAGMAYEAMRLIKRISVERHWSKPIVVGGYSMGGLVARAGLVHWCKGTWDDFNLNPAERLDKNCESVSLFFSGDAPQDGAMIPMAMQRFMHDPDVIDGAPRVDVFRQKIDSPAAREILRRVVSRGAYGAPTCNTGCADEGAFGAPCSSKSSSFTSGCTEGVADERLRLLSWLPATEDVARYKGARVPAISFSVGPSPESTMRTTSTSDPFLTVDIDWFWNMTLYPNTEDTLPGSRLDSLGDARTSEHATCNGIESREPTNQGWFGLGECYEVQVPNAYPTFVPSSSALLWNVGTTGRQTQSWKAFWYNTTASNHADPLPTYATAFLLSWINEYTKGLSDRPLCADPMISNAYVGARSKGGSVSACRGPEAPPPTPHQRICGDDICDQGEFCPEDCGI